MHIPQTEVILRHEGLELARVTLPPGEYVIGRNGDVEICADTPLISRRHAQLTINYDHLLIEDLGSSNGTFVGEQRIGEVTRLFPNQAVRLGDISVELRRERARNEPGLSLAPTQEAIRRYLPDELLAQKRYAIGSELARGGMGAILDARQNATQRTVAMKVMLGANGEGDVLRFIEEAQVTAQLEHPNIVPIYELGVDEQDQLFYTMKLVRGITLKKVLELLAAGAEATKKKYPLPALLTIFQKVCDAVAFAHSKGTIHRDLKPENIMLGDFGSVLVMDWGLAKVLGRSAEDFGPGTVATARSNSGEFGSTMVGTIMGTPAYMSPEQARGEVEFLDVRSDIYALGAILFELLQLRPVVTGADPMAVVEKVAEGTVEWAGPMPKDRPVPASLLAVCRKALALDKTQRYPSVEDLQLDLTAYQNGFATSAENAGLGKQVLLGLKRHKIAAAGIVAVLAVGVTFGTKAVVEGKRAEREAAAAKATLADLRRTAPVFSTQAKVDFEEGRFDAAIEKIGYAIQLDDTNADYHLFRANLREAAQDLAAAAEGYRRVLALRPADAATKANLALCEKLLRESDGAALKLDQQRQLLFALRTQKRLVESAPLAALIDPHTASAKAAIESRLRGCVGQSGWKTEKRVEALPDGTFKVNLRSLEFDDPSVLKGQPVSVLDLGDTGIANLSGLAGLPLRILILPRTKVTDLSPLRGMPLESLDLGATPVTDLSQLRGMKLHALRMDSTSVGDFSPLAGMPLTVLTCDGNKLLSDLSPLRGAPLVELYVGHTLVANLAPLAGAPLRKLGVQSTRVTDITVLSQVESLEELNLQGLPVTDLAPLAKLHLTSLSCAETKITGIAPLRGLPLRILNLAKTGVTDLSPLADCTTLEEITLPAAFGDLSLLRRLPKLRLISTRFIGTSSDFHPAQNAEQFWKEYDAKQAGSLRHPGEPPAPLPPSSAGKK